MVVGKGAAIGPAMANHPAVRKISFTGGLKAGQELGRIAADRVLPLTLELGGKSANIVRCGPGGRGERRDARVYLE